MLSKSNIYNTLVEEQETNIYSQKNTCLQSRAKKISMKRNSREKTMLLKMYKETFKSGNATHLSLTFR